MIEKNRIDLLKKWGMRKKGGREKQKSNLDWIFDNGKDVLNSAHGATVSAIAKCLGCLKLWGSWRWFVYLSKRDGCFEISGKHFLKIDFALLKRIQDGAAEH